MSFLEDPDDPVFGPDPETIPPEENSNPKDIKFEPVQQKKRCTRCGKTISVSTKGHSFINVALGINIDFCSKRCKSIHHQDLHWKKRRRSRK